MKLLLVGGTGVLSSAVAKMALMRGYAVTVINRGKRENIAGCEQIVSDRHDYKTIKTCIGNRHFDVVIDFLVFTGADAASSYNFYFGICDHYILISSCLVYDFSRGGMITEDSPRGLSCWKYSAGKCEAEDVLVSITGNTNCKYTIVRPFVTYGDTRIPYCLAPTHGCDWTMIFRAQAGKPIIIWDGGSGCCNIMHVDDFCVGLFGLLKNEDAYGEAFNICGDESICWKSVILALEEVSGVKLPLLDLPEEFIKKFYPERKEEIEGRSYKVFVSNEKLKRLVPDFRQTISLRDGIARTVSAYCASKHQLQVDWQYDVRCDEVINAWYAKNGQKRALGFVDYLRHNTLRSYISWINASSNKGVGFRLFRKVLNLGMRYIGGAK